MTARGQAPVRLETGFFHINHGNGGQGHGADHGQSADHGQGQSHGQGLGHGADDAAIVLPVADDVTLVVGDAAQPPPPPAPDIAPLDHYLQFADSSGSSGAGGTAESHALATMPVELPEPTHDETQHHDV